jgi:hypothetical protein
MAGWLPKLWVMSAMMLSGVSCASPKGVSQQILTEDPILASDWTFGGGNGSHIAKEENPSPQNKFSG